MIVTAKVLNKTNNQKVEIPFLVRFDHTPAAKAGEKPIRRSCIAHISILTPVELVPGESKKFATRQIPGEFFATEIVAGIVTCGKNDTYCRAFGRKVALERAVRKLITREGTLPAFEGCPFVFDTDSFKAFMTRLNEAHPHGMETARKLCGNSDYFPKKKQK